jgi:hypothetical protein
LFTISCHSRSRHRAGRCQSGFFTTTISFPRRTHPIATLLLLCRVTKACASRLLDLKNVTLDSHSAASGSLRHPRDLIVDA